MPSRRIGTTATYLTCMPCAANLKDSGPVPDYSYLTPCAQTIWPVKTMELSQRLRAGQASGEPEEALPARPPRMNVAIVTRGRALDISSV